MPTLIDQAIIYVDSYISISLLHLLAFSKKVSINENNSSMKQMPTNAWFDSESNELRKNYKYLCKAVEFN